MDAHSSDDALPSTPPKPADTPSPPKLPPPTPSQKQEDVKKLLTSFTEEDFYTFRLHLQHAFSILKLQPKDRDIFAHRRMSLCQDTLRPYFSEIVSGLSEFGPDRLPDWLARRIFTPSRDRRPILPTDGLFQVYSTWCASHEAFEFYGAMTELLDLGLQAATDMDVDKK